MKYIKELKIYLITTCISFTVVSLIQPLYMISQDVMPLYQSYYIFFVCIAINITIFITDQIPVKSNWTRYVIDIIDIIVIFYVINRFLYESSFGGLIDWLSIIFSILLTYFVVIIIVNKKNKEDEKTINEKIKKRKYLDKNK